VAMTLTGFAAAILGLHVPLVQPAILSSIVVLGLLVALAVRASLWAGVVIAGLFAFFHGHAHGTEMAGAGLIAYASGFSLATAALHALGLGVGLLIARSAGQTLLRAAGGLVVVGGLALMTDVA